MNSELSAKIAGLHNQISAYERVAVAFSGGVDSSFLAKAAREALGKKACALTIDTLFAPRAEIEAAAEVARQIHIPHETIVLTELEAPILENTRERCYLCKKSIFMALKDAARQKGISHLIEGSNLDDLDDFRPGMKALEEMGVESPLIMAGFSKADIRQASKAAGLSTWDKPSQACLASRIPYEWKITPENLKMVEAAEAFLRQKGFRQLRVRCHGELARIEVSPGERRLFFDEAVLNEVSERLKQIGFKYVAIDAEGYKTGKLNI